MQAKAVRGFGEQLLGVALFHRRRRIVALPRAFERIAAGLLCALDVAGLAGDARNIFELVVIGLEVFVGDRPVLDVIALGHDAFAVALDHVASECGNHREGNARSGRSSARRRRRRRCPARSCPICGSEALSARGCSASSAFPASGAGRRRDEQHSAIRQRAVPMLKSEAVSRHGPRSIATTSSPVRASS